MGTGTKREVSFNVISGSGSGSEENELEGQRNTCDGDMEKKKALATDRENIFLLKAIKKNVKVNEFIR